MTINHIAAGWFEGRKEAAKKRLQKLKAAGFIGERRRRLNEAAILSLTSNAIEYLNEQGTLSDYPERPRAMRDKPVSDLTLAHEIQILDVKAAFVSALAKNERLTLEEFNTWPLMQQFMTFPSSRPAGILVKPDAAVRISEAGKPSGHFFFLELDRSTESQATLTQRVDSYVSHYRSGNFAVQRGAARTDYKKFPFRVLFVMQNAERRNITIEGLLRSSPPILTQVLLSTLEEVLNDPMGSVWVRPIDYRNATADTDFDANARKPSLRYRRNTERETLVELRVKKVNLFPTPRFLRC